MNERTVEDSNAQSHKIVTAPVGRRSLFDFMKLLGRVPQPNGKPNEECEGKESTIASPETFWLDSSALQS